MSKNIGWYIVHTSSGAERQVLANIKQQIEKRKISHLFHEMLIPAVKAVETRRGRAIDVERKVMPGYIFLKMLLDDVTWSLVNNINKVIGFLGENGKPKLLTDQEIQEVRAHIEATKDNVVKGIYDIGEQIIVIDGPFENFIGNVEKVDNDKQRLTVSISIFGKATQLDLSLTQVKKNNLE